MANVDIIMPHEIIEGVKYFEKKNPGNNGDEAFRINFGNMRSAVRPGIRYLTFEFARKKNEEEREFIPINLKFMNINTQSRILPPFHEKRIYPGVKLQFAGDAYYTSNKTKGATPVSIKEEYGLARQLIARAFERLMLKAIQERTINHKNTKISVPVQFERKIDEKTMKMEALENPIHRVDIKFVDPKKKDSDNKKPGNDDKDISPDAKPKCPIYNALKKAKKTKKSDFDFEFLMHGEENPEELTYANIGFAIPPGSSVSGVDCLSNVCLSNMGISLQSYASILIVKPSKGNAPDPTKIFDQSELSSFTDEEITETTGSDPETGNPANSEYFQASEDPFDTE